MFSAALIEVTKYEQMIIYIYIYRSDYLCQIFNCHIQSEVSE